MQLEKIPACPLVTRVGFLCCHDFLGLGWPSPGSKPCPRAGLWISCCMHRSLPIPGWGVLGVWSSALVHFSWVAHTGGAPPVEGHMAVKSCHFSVISACLGWQYRMFRSQDGNVPPAKPVYSCWGAQGAIYRGPSVLFRNSPPLHILGSCPSAYPNTITKLEKMGLRSIFCACICFFWYY